MAAQPIHGRWSEIHPVRDLTFGGTGRRNNYRGPMGDGRE